ncbi:hypothetical protein [Spirillospora sp. NBC_01491]|uniref:hypothetical protein n=1 Tax=Spirillospora sp. NBC_01491 TaxID=2976007 RepID=UPI002E36F32B|nr:hypothetical protein [Spirillospora sp. NBC_01491]
MPPRRSGNPAVRAKPSAKKKAGFSLAKYREEAGGEPFPLEVDDGHVIEIPRPTGGVMMELAEKYAAGTDGQTDPREQLRDLLGETYDEVMPILEAEDFAVMFAFLNDIVEFFGLGEALASLG